MDRKAFAGDTEYRLTQKEMEPYRLWFEFLKLAYRDPSIKVDSKKYADWGDVANSDFDKWWADHWKPLFAAQSGAKIISSQSEYQDAANDPRAIVLRISLTVRSKQQLGDVRDAIAKATKGEKFKSAKGGGRFELQVKRSKRLETLRVILRMYQLWLANKEDIEVTARAYLDWAEAWNGKVDTKGWKRSKIFVPAHLKRYVELLDLLPTQKKRGASNRTSKGSVNSGTGTNIDTGRNQTRRYITQAQKIIRNVARGDFPGKYQ